MKVHWRELKTGTPIIPYAWVYQTAVANVIQRFQEPLIVEIGVYDGCSARIMKEAANGKDYEMILIDPYYHELAKEVVDESRVFFLQKKAEEVVERFDPQSIHLLHVDMDPHTYDQHVAMHELYTPKVAVGGLMIVHDCSPVYGTYKYVNEYLAKKKNWSITRIQPHKDSPSTVPIVAKKLN